MRVRTHDGQPLPKGVYFKHGAYYRVVGNQWLRLGTDPSCAGWPAFNLPSRLNLEQKAILAHAYQALTRARQNAKGRSGGIEFTLTRAHVHRMLNEAGWRCAVTGADFALEVVNGARPFAPSIDRRNSAEGYIPDNCRIVCIAANYAMNVWGEAVLWRLFDRRASKRVLDSLSGLDETLSK